MPPLRQRALLCPTRSNLPLPDWSTAHNSYVKVEHHIESSASHHATTDPPLSMGLHNVQCQSLAYQQTISHASLLKRRLFQCKRFAMKAKVELSRIVPYRFIVICSTSPQLSASPLPVQMNFTQSALSIIVKTTLSVEPVATSQCETVYIRLGHLRFARHCSC